MESSRACRRIVILRSQSALSKWPRVIYFFGSSPFKSNNMPPFVSIASNESLAVSIFHYSILLASRKLLYSNVTAR